MSQLTTHIINVKAGYAGPQNCIFQITTADLVMVRAHLSLRLASTNHLQKNASIHYALFKHFNIHHRSSLT